MRGPIAAIGLVSVALIAFQLALMQMLSQAQWHHFAHLIISVSLLGFGASGTILSLFRDALLKRSDALVPALLFATGLLAGYAGLLSRMEWVRFDMILFYLEGGQALRLAFTCLVYFLPVLTGALAIILLLAANVHKTGELYFSNLTGSGLGGLAAIGGMFFFAPEQLLPLIGMLAVAGGFCVAGTAARRATGAASVLLLSAVLLTPGSPELSQFKGLSRALNLPEAEVVAESHSPQGRIHVVSSPALRYAPGLSLAYTGPIPVANQIFISGNAAGPVLPRTGKEDEHLLDYSTRALAYAFGSRKNVLVLRAGTGVEVGQAVSRGAERVAAVEPHARLVDLLVGPVGAEANDSYNHPRVTVKVSEPRTYLARSEGGYDLIQMPTVEAFGGSAGLQALQEENLLTVEAIGTMWARLADEGVLTLTSWMDYPYRSPLRLLALLVDGLERAGVGNPEDHLVAVRGWGTVTFAAKKTALTDTDVAHIRAFSEAMFFDPLLLPGLEQHERQQYNELETDDFFVYVDRILAPDREMFFREYPFAVRPPSDNRPYFSQFLRWRHRAELEELFGEHGFPFLEIGSLVAAQAFVQVTVGGIVLIILPLFRLGGWRGKDRLTTLMFFGGIGLGYMALQMVLIQRFTIFWGHPLYAVAGVVGIMMFGMGLGSLTTSRFALKASVLQTVMLLAFLFSLLMAMAMGSLLEALTPWTTAARWMAGVAMLFPWAFLLGMPFPLGLRLLARQNGDQVPWAWGIDGCASVISASGAALLAVYLGFNTVMLMGVAAYLCAFAASRGFRQAAGPC